MWTLRDGTATTLSLGFEPRRPPLPLPLDITRRGPTFAGIQRREDVARRSPRQPAIAQGANASPRPVPASHPRPRSRSTIRRARAGPRPRRSSISSPLTSTRPATSASARAASTPHPPRASSASGRATRAPSSTRPPHLPSSKTGGDGASSRARTQRGPTTPSPSTSCDRPGPPRGPDGYPRRLPPRSPLSSGDATTLAAHHPLRDNPIHEHASSPRGFPCTGTVRRASRGLLEFESA
jgi:hypothetical protein